MAVPSSFAAGLLCVLLLSCHPQTRQTAAAPLQDSPATPLQGSPAPSLRDSLIKPYLEALAHAQAYDTTDPGNRVLKAYLSNDTPYLKDLAEKLTWKKKSDSANAAIDCRTHIPHLADLHADEAYRFIYGLALSPYSFNITIWRTGDSIQLHFIKYYISFADSFVCRTVRDNRAARRLRPRRSEGSELIRRPAKPLTTRQWQELTQSLKDADLWGLKFDNGVHGVDGSSLTVSGYIAPETTKYYHHPARYTNVYRWGNSTLDIAWNVVEKLSSDRAHRDIWHK
jgi:hypothetical protein